MKDASDSYEDVVTFYINLVRLDSPQAAGALEQIRATVGSQAALRAALIITVIRMELRQKLWIPDRGVYANLIGDYPEAAPLLEYAIGYCMNVWGVESSEAAQPNRSDFNIDTAAPSE